MVPFCCLHLTFRNRRTQTNLPGGLHRVFDVTGCIWISWTLNCDQGGEKELHQTVMMSLERRAIKLVKLYTVNKELAPKKKKKPRIRLYAYKQDGEKELPQTVLPYRFPINNNRLANTFLYFLEHFALGSTSFLLQKNQNLPTMCGRWSFVWETCLPKYLLGSVFFLASNFVENSSFEFC